MHRSSARRRSATLLLPVAATLLSLAGAGVITGAPASGAGIVPPSNPSANIAPDSSDWLTAIDGARSQEGVGDMDISEAAFDALPLDQQVFTVVNNERVDRGLPPIDYITSQLDGYAQGGANAGTDPSFPTALTGGSPITYGGSIWAGGLTSVLEADYYWMYDDGYSGSSTSNSACSLSNPSGCWGHRDIILHEYANCPSGPPILSMGAAFASDFGRLHRRHLRQLVFAADRHHGQLGPARLRGPVRLADGRHRADRPTAPATGRRRRTARSPPSAPPRTTAP